MGQKVETRAPKLKAVDQTKFDHWLMECERLQKPIEMHFAMPPRNSTANVTETVHVIDVDKFNLLLEFSDGECFWVSKSIVMSSGLASD